MYRKNKQHLQKSMFGSINSLPEKILRVSTDYRGGNWNQLPAREDPEAARS